MPEDETTKAIIQDITKIVAKYAGQDIEKTLSVLSGNFVGLYEAYIKQYGNGLDPKQEIELTGGYRPITIHPEGFDPSTDENHRSEQQIVDQTNELARMMYANMGYEVAEGYCFHKARHPTELVMWESACNAQKMLTNTDPEDALGNL